MSHTLEVVEGPVDLVAVPLHGAHLREVEHVRNRGAVRLDLVHDLLVQLELDQGLQEIVLLGSHVDTVENRPGDRPS